MLGFQPVNITVQFYGNAVHPEGVSPGGHAAANCSAVPQPNQGTGEGAAGAKIEADESGSTARTATQIGEGKSDLGLGVADRPLQQGLFTYRKK